MKSLVFFFLIALTANLYSQTVTVNVQNIESKKGKLQLAVFSSSKQFEDEKADKVFYFSKESLSDGNMTISFDLDPGEYGFTIIDDEDENQNMTYRFGIYPLEGVGFSGFKLTGMSKPDFDDFKFNHGNSNTTITSQLRYF